MCVEDRDYEVIRPSQMRMARLAYNVLYLVVRGYYQNKMTSSYSGMQMAENRIFILLLSPSKEQAKLKSCI